MPNGHGRDAPRRHGQVKAAIVNGNGIGEPVVEPHLGHPLTRQPDAAVGDAHLRQHWAL